MIISCNEWTEGSYLRAVKNVFGRQACASGRLLMVAHFPYHLEKRIITGEQS
jgi:hypothetical protein